LQNIIVAYGSYFSGDADGTLFEGGFPYPDCLAVGPSGKLFSGHPSGVIIEHDVRGRVVRRLVGHTERVQSIALLPEGQLVSASWDSTLIVWDSTTGEKRRTLVGHDGGVLRVVGLPDGRVVSAGRDCTMRVWDIVSGKCIKIFQHPRPVRSLAVLGDGRVVSGCMHDLSLRVWSIAGGQNTEQDRPAVFVLPSRSFLALMSAPMREVDMSRSTMCVLALADGRVASSGGAVGVVHIRELTTGQYTSVQTGHNETITSMAELPDGRVVSTAWLEDNLRVWDPRTGVCSLTLLGHISVVRDVIVLPDGSVASSSLDGTIRVWR
jgi:WD40 repeat protein